MGKSLTIEAMQELAHAKNGECLSSRYVNAVTKLRWRCAKGHEWEAQPSMVKNEGTWCPFCSGNLKHTIEVMKELAKQRGGECLADHYVNAFAKLRWRCAKGHEWEACGSAIKNHKTWCPICAYDVVSSKTSLGLDEMREIARSRGGECLSEAYPRRHGGKLLWRCRDGHEWEAPPAQVKHAKQWCPICASGYSERLCKAMFEAIFNERFPKARPLWLKNSRGNHMELDGYCKKLGVAFEYHGIQHYEEKVFFHRKSSLSLRQQDDNTKRLLCKEHGVSLIEIPYSIQPDELQAYIYSQCNKLNISVVKKPTIKLADLDYYSRNRIDEMRSFAAAKGGECLVDRYVTVITPVMWRCQKGHEWKSAYHYIRNKGSWCPVCAGKIKLTIDDMHALAKTKGGECLSTVYRNLMGKLTWRCSMGHEWNATANDVKNSGSWCPVCAGVKKHDLKTMMDIARNRGGECLSNAYVNSKTKLQWRCAKGHEWVAAPATILSSRGTWCPYCARKAKLTIQEMRQIAIARDGKCLSDNYINGSTKLRWQCRSGHEWLATPDNVKNGESWCPICAQRTKSS
jgi:hypothetical protein